MALVLVTSCLTPAHVQGVGCVVEAVISVSLQEITSQGESLTGDHEIKRT
jgi:hypothetical protein